MTTVKNQTFPLTVQCLYLICFYIQLFWFTFFANLKTIVIWFVFRNINKYKCVCRGCNNRLKGGGLQDMVHALSIRTEGVFCCCCIVRGLRCFVHVELEEFGDANARYSYGCKCYFIMYMTRCKCLEYCEHIVRL